MRHFIDHQKSIMGAVPGALVAAEAEIVIAMEARWNRLYNIQRSGRYQLGCKKFNLSNVMNSAYGVCRNSADSLLSLVACVCNVIL